MSRSSVLSLVLLTAFTGWLLSGWYPVPPATAQNAADSASEEWLQRLVTDGSGDQSAVLQAWIDSGAGDIRLPPGRIRLEKTVTVDLDRVGPTSIHGDGVATLVMAAPGPAIRFVGTHFKSADPGGFGTEVWDRQRMPLVDGIGITGIHPEADGIAAEGTMQLTISRVHVRKVRHAIHLLKNNRNVIVSDCHLYENSGVGVFYDDVNLHQSNIVGSHISYNAGGGIVSVRGNVRNIHIAGCDLESNMSPDTDATANVLIDCRGSQYGTAEVAITGCTIQHNNPSPDSANIRIIGRSDPSRDQDLVREGNITIAGNVLSDVQCNIHLRDCRGVAITGNTLWMGYQHNLLIEDCSNIVLGANNLDRNPRYAYGNTSEARNAVVFRRCQDCTISGLHVTGVLRNPAAVLLENCSTMNLSDSTILDSDGVGLMLDDCEMCHVSGCLIQDRRTRRPAASLMVSGGTGNVVVDNLIQRQAIVDSPTTVSRNHLSVTRK